MSKLIQMTLSLEMNPKKRQDVREPFDLMIDSCGGVPVVSIKPELTISTDDSTFFIVCESTIKMDDFCFVTKESCI